MVVYHKRTDEGSRLDQDQERLRLELRLRESDLLWFHRRDFADFYRFRIGAEKGRKGKADAVLARKVREALRRLTF